MYVRVFFIATLQWKINFPDTAASLEAKLIASSEAAVSEKVKKQNRKYSVFRCPRNVCYPVCDYNKKFKFVHWRLSVKKIVGSVTYQTEKQN